MNVARAAFILLTTLLGISIAFGRDPNLAWIGALSGLGFGFFVIVIDLVLRNFSIRGFSTGTFGLLVGLLCAWLVTSIGFFESPPLSDFVVAQQIFDLAVYLGLGFLGLMLALRSKREEFSLIIPYVRFRQEAVHDQPLLVDTNIIIDGRLQKLCATGFVEGSLVVPSFVLDELQTLADSKDKLKSQRGKRGLEALKRMQQIDSLDVTIDETDPQHADGVDAKLIQIAGIYDARLITNDANLAKVARLQGVKVLHLNELAKALRPTVAPGDEVELTLVKEGKDDHQAVGYLPDGTMIVVNQAIREIGTTQQVVVAGAVQTSAGQLIFAELKDAS